MTDRTCAARRAMAILGTVVAVALAMACGNDGEAGPTGPSVVDARPTTSTSANASALVDVAGGSSVGQPHASGAGVNDLDLSGREGVVRNAVRSDAMIAKPVILELARVETSELSLQWAVTSTTDIVDYRIQWSPGCIATWSRKLGSESVFFTSTGGTQELTGIMPGGGNLFHRAFKVRIRARMAANTATHRKGGPWSDVELLYPGNPSSRKAGTSDICDVGQRTVTGDATYCYANIAGAQATLDIDGTLNAELEPGGGRATLNAAHAAGASISSGGFRAEARTSPDAWEIVSLDREWRDYC